MMGTFRNFIFLIIITVGFSSCRKFEQEKVIARADPFAVTNLYPIERLPSYFNRVAVLPCYYPDFDSPVLEFVDEIFQQELAQQRIFETIPLDPLKMKEEFGVSRVSSTSELPENFLRSIEQITGANGVLFVDIDSYRPYRPISLGVRAKLIDLKSGEFMWAIDETFDAGRADIIVGAKIFQEKSHIRALYAKTSGSVTQSPRVFAKYAASLTFSTLPRR